MNRPASLSIPEKEIELVEAGRRPRNDDSLVFNLDRDLNFSTKGLEYSTFARWEPLLFDAMVVAAAIEFGDRVVPRPSGGWARRLSLRIPVHDPDRWSEVSVLASLHDAIGFLTGDCWNITFVKRITPAPVRRQKILCFPFKASAILAYSDGMDSRAVAGILGKKFGQSLVRVRVGSSHSRQTRRRGERQPFATVPYSLKITDRVKESSARNRGFKFAIISAIAAYLADADEIIIPESGQGVIGPALIIVGHAYPDFRNHPLFTKRMEHFVNALFRQPIQYVFPRIWNTKAETLRDSAALTGEADWKSTRSCWRDSRWSSFHGRRRQCGICAACMLRRLSVHAAGLTEDPDIYICTDMTAPTLQLSVAPGFSKLNGIFEQYAIAGVLHLDHLADMASEEADSLVRRHATLVAPALGLTPRDASIKLAGLLHNHSLEWGNYMKFLGEGSFVRKWARVGQ